MHPLVLLFFPSLVPSNRMAINWEEKFIFICIGNNNNTFIAHHNNTNEYIVWKIMKRIQINHQLKIYGKINEHPKLLFSLTQWERRELERKREEEE